MDIGEDIPLKGSQILVPAPLHQPSLHYPSEGLMGSADLRKDVEQLQLLVQRVEVEQRDDEDDRRILPPTILREQQRSTGRTCVEVGGRTFLQLRKPGVSIKSTTTTTQAQSTAPSPATEANSRERWAG